MIIDTLIVHCFIAVAETGSFTKAAERVGRTQSAISQQIAKLENYLGVMLVERGKQTGLTAEGEIFLGYARRIFALHREAVDRFKEPDLAGEVRFGLPEDFATVYLSDVLVEFTRLHPRIMLNIECDLTVNLFERFQRREFDLVLVKMHRPGDFPHGVEVWSEHLEWVCDPGIASSLNDSSTVLPLVLSPRPCVYRASALHALEQAGNQWRLVFSSPSYAGTIAAVKAGLGVTVLPRTMIPPELIAISPSHLPELSNTHLSLLKHDNSNPALQSFEAFVLNKLQH